jgi:hypothetical protein
MEWRRAVTFGTVSLASKRRLWPPPCEGAPREAQSDVSAPPKTAEGRIVESGSCGRGKSEIFASTRPVKMREEITDHRQEQSCSQILVQRRSGSQRLGGLVHAPLFMLPCLKPETTIILISGCLERTVRNTSNPSMSACSNRESLIQGSSSQLLSMPPFRNSFRLPNTQRSASS